MKKYITASLLLLLPVLYYIANLGPPSPALHPISIAVSRTPLCAPLYIAEEMGFFRQQGVDVQLDEVVGGDRSFLRVMDKKADLGTSSESVLMFASLRQAPHIALASFVQSDNDIKLVSRASADIRQLSNLKHKKIGLIKESASEYFLSTLLALAQADSSEVELIPMPANEMPEALNQGLIDAAAVWEPYAYNAAQLLKQQSNILPSKNLYTLSFNLVTHKETLQNKRESMIQVLHAIDQAIDYITLNPEQAQSILKKRLALDDDFIQWIWPDYIFKLSLNRSLIFTMENEARWAIQNGLTDNPNIPAFIDHIDKSLLESVKAEAITL